MNDTADYIIDKIANHYDFIKRHWDDIDLEDWEDYCQGLELEDELMSPYGWTFPPHHTFCADLISLQTEHLDQGLLDDYLTAILWIVDRHIVIAHEQPGLSTMDRHGLVVSELHEVADESLMLMSDVQLHALTN